MVIELVKENVKVHALKPVIGETGLTLYFMDQIYIREIIQKFISTNSIN